MIMDGQILVKTISDLAWFCRTTKLGSSQSISENKSGNNSLNQYLLSSYHRCINHLEHDKAIRKCDVRFRIQRCRSLDVKGTLCLCRRISP